MCLACVSTGLNATIRSLCQHGASQIEDRIDQAQNLQSLAASRANEKNKANTTLISMGMTDGWWGGVVVKLTAAVKYWLNSRYC